jgi:hypothetical protein
MSAPMEPFLGVSLSTQLGFTSTTLEQRTIVALDIVSSFDPDLLPSEFQPEVIQSITDGQSNRPHNEWTIPVNLPGTVLLWTVHDPDCWTFLNKCQPPDIRAVLFAQKLRRRLGDEFERYDRIRCPPPRESAPGLQTGTDSQSLIVDISSQIRGLVVAAAFDLDHRSGNQRSITKILLEALEATCARHTDISPTAQGGELPMSSTDRGISLYDHLVRRPPSDEPTFILDALERVPPYVLRAMADHVEIVRDTLAKTNPPQGYWGTFCKLSARAGLT